jgi:hypothetical protein
MGKKPAADNTEDFGLSEQYEAFLDRLRRRYSGRAHLLLYDLEYFVDSAEVNLASNPIMSENDVERLQRATAGLRDAAKLFYEKVDYICGDDCETYAAIYSAVDELFKHALELGKFHNLQPDFWPKIREQRSAQKARDGKIPHIKRRRDIIRARYPSNDLVNSDKFAESILPQVNEELARFGIEETSARTLRRDIEAILKGHSDRVRKK